MEKSGEAGVDLRWVLVREVGSKDGVQALFCTDVCVSAAQVVAWYVMRWSEEVTFQEVRAHLGMETQRQWSTLAVKRETPLILGMYSVVVLMGERLTRGMEHPIRQAAWYQKQEATFADTLALVRGHLLRTVQFPQSGVKTRQREIPITVLEGLVDCFCYAA